MDKIFRAYVFSIIIMLFAQSANAGGWEASTADTSFLYNQGNYAEIGSAQITYDVTANIQGQTDQKKICLLYTSPSPRDTNPSRMPSSA